MARRLYPLLNRTLRYLLVGAITTTLVAWACILFAHPFDGSSPPVPPGGTPADVTGPPGEEPSLWFTRRGTGWTEAYVVAGYRINGDGGDDSFKDWLGSGTPHLRAAGWPWIALQSRIEVVEAPDERHPTRWQLPLSAILRRGIPSASIPTDWLTQIHPSLYANGRTRLPLLPAWPGFVVDTLLYASTAFLLTQLCRRTLHLLRRQPRGFPVEILPPSPKSETN